MRHYWKYAVKMNGEPKKNAGGFHLVNHLGVSKCGRHHMFWRGMRDNKKDYAQGLFCKKCEGKKP